MSKCGHIFKDFTRGNGGKKSKRRLTPPEAGRMVRAGEAKKNRQYDGWVIKE
jgi:hypothetical protein